MSMNVGICGFGKMGQIRADAIETHGFAQIKSVFDVNIPDGCKYPVANSIDEIIEDPDIDIVFLCLPNYFNKPKAIMALKAGKHVFCEKPPAFSAQDVRDIQEVERASGKVLMYGFNHRQHGAIDKMKSIVDSRKFGSILWMRSRYGKSVDGDYLNTWRAKKELAGGGILLDQGIHMLDLLLYLTGKPFDEVHAMVSNMYWKTPGIEDNVFAIMRNTQTGVTASVHSTMTQWRHLFSLEVFMERGYMVLNGLKTSSGTYGDEILTIAQNRTTAPAATWEDEERLTFHIDQSWAREIELFFDSVQNGAPVKFGSSDQAIEVMSLIDMIYEHDLHQAPNLADQLNMTVKELT
jgi:predicted dehydrogenase